MKERRERRGGEGRKTVAPFPEEVPGQEESSHCS